MRYLAAVLIFAACGGGSDSAKPYSAEHSEMCGLAPTGQWDVTVDGTPDILPDMDLCASNPYPVWNFDSPVITANELADEGCRIHSTGVIGYIDVSWTASSEYKGTIYVFQQVGHGTCTFSAHVTLTPHQ